MLDPGFAGVVEFRGSTVMPGWWSCGGGGGSRRAVMRESVNGAE